jgi:hypothetical protein
MKFSDPRGESASRPVEYNARLRVGEATVALLSNSYTDASRYLEYLSIEMASEAPELTFRLFEKESTVGQARSSLLDEIADTADAVVAAYGHCGSCTSGTVRDAIAMGSRGIPSVALVTDRFWDLSRFIAVGGGMESVPRVMLPYPVAGADESTMRSIAAESSSTVLAALRGTTR